MANPIALAFAKIKRALRTILQTFSTTECANYLRHAGYVQT